MATARRSRTRPVCLKLSLVVCCLVAMSSSFVAAFVATPRPSLSTTGFHGKACFKYSRTTKEVSSQLGLQMGLRSFIRRKTHALQDKFSSRQTLKDHNQFPPLSYDSRQLGGSKPVRMGEDPFTKEINVNRRSSIETAQERIERLKALQMTEAEKEAFLATALSGSRSSTTPRSSRITDQDRLGRASPFPKDSIIRDIVASGGNTTLSKNSQTTKYLSDAQKKKQQYLDMVTDPNRFHSYKSSQKPRGPLPADLGARLGAAAMASELKSKDLKQMRAEQDEQLQRTNQIEMADVLRKKEEDSKLGDVSRSRAEQEKAREEEERMEAMKKAQEEYWARKVGKEARVAAKPVPLDDVDDSSSDNDEESELQSKVEPRTQNDVQNEDPPNRRPLSDNEDSRSMLSFQEELAIQREKMERQRELQLQRLKALNSPLPSRVAGDTRGVVPGFRPQKSINSPASPSSQALRSLGENIDNVNRQPPARSLDAERNASSFLPIDTQSTSKDLLKQSTLRQSPWGGQVNSPKADEIRSRSGLAPAKPETTPRKVSSSPPKQPIRQTIPGMEDDFEQVEGMTIGEMMKRKQPAGRESQDDRAKRWGVDMSRFRDD